MKWMQIKVRRLAYEAHLPLLIAATRDQYPVWTVRFSELHPSLHWTPYRQSVPSYSDQKLKFRDEMRKIQSMHSRVLG